MAHRLRTCFDCAAQVEPDALVCSACGSAELTYGRSKARQPIVLESPELPWPWSTAIRSLPAGGLVGLYGAKGSGKSSLAAVLQPDLWLTSEQSNEQASATLTYAQGASWTPTEVQAVGTPDEVRAHLAQVHEGLVVLDSATRCGGLREQLAALESMEAWANGGPGRRGLVVLQVNDKGEPAGLTELEHAVTTICGVIGEESGLRRIITEKNRFGPLGVAYFRLGSKGLERPQLRYSYSVEGAHGQYRLVPWPTPGARWAGLLDALFTSAEGEVFAVAGLASAGRQVPGYPNDRLLPADVDERRAFAEAHGLTWLT